MALLLNRGNVIRTNPAPGYWGVAVVLSECEETAEFEPLCHIALTPLVFRHALEFSELNLRLLEILKLENSIDLLGTNPHHSKDIGVYSRITDTPIFVVGNIDPTQIYDGPLPFSPDWGLDVTWPLCGTVPDNFGIKAIASWLRIHDPKALDELFLEREIAGTAIEQEEGPENQLWIMMQTDQFFNSTYEARIEEDLINIVESGELGEFDGHSSGAHQFDLNFFDVRNFDDTKNVITNYLNKKYPNLKFVISRTYETTFDRK